MNNEELYRERLQRIRRAIDLQPVSRIPLIFMGIAFAPRYMGMSMARFCEDPDAPLEVTLAAMDRLGGWDGVNSLPSGNLPLLLSGLWMSRVAAPGRDLPDDSLWQVVEAETMAVADYDAIIHHGWRAFVQQYLPRIVDVQAFQAEMGRLMADPTAASIRARERGYVTLRGGVMNIPFEPLCGGRSMPRFYRDLYKIPDKVKATMDAMMPEMIASGIAGAKACNAMGAWIGGWRSASSMLAPKLWDKFVFPYMLQAVEALTQNSIIAILHLDQDWTRDLARFRDFPARKFVLNLDGMTNVRKAKEILGEHAAILGDVPASLFSTGTPDDIYNYVRDLVRDVGPTGLLLCPGCDAPINTKPENMEAFVAAAREYGTLAHASHGHA